jgi:hypothetical protein
MSVVFKVALGQLPEFPRAVAGVSAVPVLRAHTSPSSTQLLDAWDAQAASTTWLT